MSLKQSRDELCKFFKNCTQGPDGRYSHSKVIACLGFVALTFFMWKIIIAGTMSVDYFIAYACYCTGHQTMNKWLDGKKTKTEVTE